MSNSHVSQWSKQGQNFICNQAQVIAKQRNRRHGNYAHHLLKYLFNVDLKEGLIYIPSEKFRYWCFDCSINFCLTLLLEWENIERIFFNALSFSISIIWEQCAYQVHPVCTKQINAIGAVMGSIFPQIQRSETSWSSVVQRFAGPFWSKWTVGSLTQQGLRFLREYGWNLWSLDKDKTHWMGARLSLSTQEAALVAECFSFGRYAENLKSFSGLCLKSFQRYSQLRNERKSIVSWQKTRKGQQGG